MLDSADKPRLSLLLDHFALIEDDRKPWRVAHPLPEVLLLLFCGTIGAGDDFDEIVEWGEDNLAFLRRFLLDHHGIPGARWLRILLNRIDPALFSACFESWACSLRQEPPVHVALDGKTSRGSHDRRRGCDALHLVSAFATRERLVIGQDDIGEGGCEQTTIPVLLDRLAEGQGLKGALVTIDAITCNRVFKEDKVRSRTGHGLRNMAVVRHFALNLGRAVDDKRSSSAAIRLARRSRWGRVAPNLHRLLRSP